MANVLRFSTELDDNVSKKLKGISKAFDKLGGPGSGASLFGNVGARAVAKGFSMIDAAASGVVNVLGDALHAAMEEEVSVKKLDTALRANIVSWDGNTEAIEKVLTARMALGFSDDEQRSLAGPPGGRHQRRQQGAGHPAHGDGPRPPDRHRPRDGHEGPHQDGGRRLPPAEVARHPDRRERHVRGGPDRRSQGGRGSGQELRRHDQRQAARGPDQDRREDGGPRRDHHAGRGLRPRQHQQRHLVLLGRPERQGLGRPHRVARHLPGGRGVPSAGSSTRWPS